MLSAAKPVSRRALSLLKGNKKQIPRFARDDMLGGFLARPAAGIPKVCASLRSG
jgi:hypothetical protein